MAAYTSIQLLPATKDKLSALKSGSRETYDGLINKLLEMVPEEDDEGRYTSEFRVSLLNARLEFLNGRAISNEEMKKRLGI